MNDNKKHGAGAGIGHNRHRKTTAERQKTLYQRRTEAGWKKTWVDPDTAALAAELGGIEHITEDRQRLATLVADQMTALDEMDQRLAALDVQLERERNNVSPINRLILALLGK